MDQTPSGNYSPNEGANPAGKYRPSDEDALRAFTRGLFSGDSTDLNTLDYLEDS